MLGNLKAEMARRGIAINDIAACTGLCRNSIRSKLQGRSAFSVYEAFEIRHKYFPDIPLEKLFERDAATRRPTYLEKEDIK